jgi:phosphopantothenoylcysteine synthetase/decarboxylase
VLVTTPTAASWIDESRVSEFTAWPIRSTQRAVNEPKTYPAPNLVVAAPMTFNTINKWAAGINDNAALGVLNEALGDRVPIVASPVAKASLVAHPAFARSLDVLASTGVRLTATNAITSSSDSGAYDWRAVLDAMKESKQDS